MSGVGLVIPSGISGVGCGAVDIKWHIGCRVWGQVILSGMLLSGAGCGQVMPSGKSGVRCEGRGGQWCWVGGQVIPSGLEWDDR